MHQISQRLTDVVEYGNATQTHVNEIRKELLRGEVRAYLENKDAHMFFYSGGGTVAITLVVTGPGRLQPVRCAIERAIRRVDETLTKAA